ncbi:MAG: peptide deformylase [Gammaproteobacteria bacterium RIFCSPLOWO2_02_FULL_47_50]|nr:MAG: peptide deformylase [Gammaproteobacteria bacterium RIFCSPLOWO2_01_FULL_47_190]OGT75811.1 MAG: peptide deformylase [Gammaproteobacteria bacterium RIFCSPLOWO2_12_47_11]OGT80485.1 MAG: peptide deformylase [Gammaproteobacteria bacterium RIFCSPLOWO2_02_FULL_47_50]OGT87776.1 MAG: peptide deformylase [Gammaproteobacteria bacterium RIFCSPLOWO2_12_FULL_47_76]
MAILDILHFPDPNLRKKARPVETIDARIKTLASDMLETMYKEGGIGLAATQVNVQKRVVVIDLSELRNEPMYLINPEIISSEGVEQMQEGCLSVPDYYDLVERAEKVSFRYLNLAGEAKEVNADGLLAVCIQHEIDHLDGKLFIDYLSPLKRQRLRKKLEKQDKLQAQIL